MEIKSITSKKNPIIKDASLLNKSASERYENEKYIAEGARLVLDAALSGVYIEALFYTESAGKKYKSYIDKAKEKAKDIYIIDDHVALSLADTKSSQGVYALCRMNKKGGVLKGRTVVLENIQDPSNMGNVLRTGEALGIDTFILTGECCDIYSPKVLRASMGAVFRANVIPEKDLNKVKNLLKKENYSLYGSVPLNTAKKITEIEINTKTAVAIGNEGDGLSDEFKHICDALVTIPMLGRAESLNAASAAGIIMWEMVR